MTLQFVRGTRIVVENYLRHKAQIDEFCRKYAVAYEIHKDGSAVILCD